MNEAVLSAACRVLERDIVSWRKDGGPFTVQIDLVGLSQTEPSLFSFLSDGDSNEARELFREASRQVLNHDDEVVSEVSKRAPVAVEISFRSALHVLPGCDIRGRADLRRAADIDVRRLRGVLTAKTDRVQYIRSSWLECSTPQCSGLDDKTVSILASDRGSFCTDDELFCLVCDRPLVEDFRRRIVSERLCATFLPLGARTLSRRPQALNVLVRDEWISLLHVGEQYEIIGQLVSSRDNLCGVMMECFHIEALPSLNQRRSLGQDIQLPHAVLEYIRSRPYSPWDIVQKLTDILGSFILPPKGSAAAATRMGILLSLASNPRCVPIPLVIVCEDSTLVRWLLKRGLSLAETSLVHSDSAASSAGESLARAAGGVCLMGDLGHLTRRITDQVMKAIETGSHDADASSKYTLQCNIWTVLETTTMPKVLKTPEFIAKLSNVFGTIFFVKLDSSLCHEDVGCYVVERLAGRWSTSSCWSEAYQNDLKMFISQVSQWTSCVDQEASTLMKSYFVASRRARGTGSRQEVPQTALKALTDLCQAHARLSLRPVARVPDALAAIALFEENLTAQYGYSPIEEPDKPEKDYTSRMTHFYGSLNKFIGAYTSDLSLEE